MGATAGTGFMASNSRAPSSAPPHVYRPAYANYSSPAYRAIVGSAQGLGATPQARMFTPQAPMFNRPSTPMMPAQQTQYRIPYRESPQNKYGTIYKALERMPGPNPLNILRQITNQDTPSPPSTGYRIPYMTQAQYEIVNPPSSGDDGGGSVDGGQPG